MLMLVTPTHAHLMFISSCLFSTLYHIIPCYPMLPYLSCPMLCICPCDAMLFHSMLCNVSTHAMPCSTVQYNTVQRCLPSEKEKEISCRVIEHTIFQSIRLKYTVLTVFYFLSISNLQLPSFLNSFSSFLSRLSVGHEICHVFCTAYLDSY